MVAQPGKMVAMPSDMRSIQNWFVSSIGQVYTSPTIPFIGQPTAIPGTIVPATPVPFPTGSTSVGADLSRPSPIYRPSSLVAIHNQTLPCNINAINSTV